jgi:hypothetical protein
MRRAAASYALRVMEVAADAWNIPERCPSFKRTVTGTSACRPTQTLGPKEGSSVKRVIRFVGVAFPLLLVLAGSGVWNAAFRVPSSNLLPLPDELIAVDSSTGKELLAEKGFIADYESLTKNFESQSRPAFCGVASSVVVLNALRRSEPRLTQSTIFTDSASKVRGALQTTFGGMSLAQLSDLLRAHGVEVTPFYASDTNLDAFRSIAQQNLKTPGDFLLVNYQRATLGQNETGHISPIAAYNAAADRLLILDVATYKYPPVWVSTEALWNAMNTVDAASGRTRGFVVVREAQPVVPADGRRSAGSAAAEPRRSAAPLLE